MGHHTYHTPHVRHSVEENISYTRVVQRDPSISLPETVDEVFDPGLEDFHTIMTHIPVGDGCTRKSGRKWL